MHVGQWHRQGYTGSDTSNTGDPQLFKINADDAFQQLIALSTPRSSISTCTIIA